MGGDLLTQGAHGARCVLEGVLAWQMSRAGGLE